MKQLIIASIPMIELVLESLEANAYSIQLELSQANSDEKQNQLHKKLSEIEELADHCKEIISNLK